ncbi:MAG TPA: hypothetical protein VKV80_16120 [Streptosporangiaceae bacterium]|nr:hypothetical protein [Streptosporangiaceae bacterium]
MPVSSFFFVSTGMTGSPPAWNAVTRPAMYSNWALRSGCCLPSIVLLVP